MAARVFRIGIQTLLLIVALAQFVIALVGLPRMLDQTSFFDIYSMERLGVYLIAGGLLPAGILKALQQRPTGWVWIILAQFFWFSWVTLSLDLSKVFLEVFR